MIMINKNPDPKAMLKQLGRDAINLLAMAALTVLRKSNRWKQASGCWEKRGIY